MELDSWTKSLVDIMKTVWRGFTDFAPNLFAAIIVVLLGFIVAKLLDTLFSKLLAKLGVDRIMTGAGLTKSLHRIGINVPVSTLVGKIIYWFVLLIFIVAGVRFLGLESVSAILTSLALYIPKVIAAAIVLLVGILIAQFVNGVVRGASEGVGIEYAAGIGRIAQGLIIIISISVAIGQLEIKAELLNYVVAILLATIGLGVAIALGLGSHEVAGQIIAGIYVREQFQVGQRIKIEDIEGILDEVGTVKTTILTDEGLYISFANKDVLTGRVISH
ncbi:mechanosensitive ion channel domain-containing protein [Pseudomonas sp. F1_0610]|uniref:mechanosensitive ion channel family protein n=1 Tax=Pseudomonas sp. F1_0610 TaxID=3114284 RepID=UPI0039C190C8